MIEAHTFRWRGMVLAGALALTGNVAQAVGLPACLPDAKPDAGKAIYGGTCQVCHGPDGKGAIPGVPDLRAADGPLTKPNDVLIEHIKNGFADSGSPLAMPPKGGNPTLSDQDVRNVVAFLHRDIHHHHHCK